MVHCKWRFFGSIALLFDPPSWPISPKCSRICRYCNRNNVSIWIDYKWMISTWFHSLPYPALCSVLVLLLLRRLHFKSMNHNRITAEIWLRTFARLATGPHLFTWNCIVSIWISLHTLFISIQINFCICSESNNVSVCLALKYDTFSDGFES